MSRPNTEWRERMISAMTRARTVERQAAGLRVSLGDLAGGHGDPDAVKRSIAALRWQLDACERLAQAMTDAGKVE